MEKSLGGYSLLEKDRDRNKSAFGVHDLMDKRENEILETLRRLPRNEFHEARKKIL